MCRKSCYEKSRENLFPCLWVAAQESLRLDVRIRLFILIIKSNDNNLRQEWTAWRYCGIPLLRNWANMYQKWCKENCLCLWVVLGWSFNLLISPVILWDQLRFWLSDKYLVNINKHRDLTDVIRQTIMKRYKECDMQLDQSLLTLERSQGSSSGRNEFPNASLKTTIRTEQAFSLVRIAHHLNFSNKSKILVLNIICNSKLIR